LVLDDNWELINGDAAHHIEQLNATSTINVLEALVTLLVGLRKQSGQPEMLMPNDRALCELHRSGTLFLLHHPGEYRDIEVHVGDKATGEIIFQPPPCDALGGHIEEFFRELTDIWNTGDALDAAAFVLWRINWIHPFRNGNGRTARAFAYACLCAKLGVMLPGRTTVIDQIMTSRSEYEAAIRAADRAAAESDGRNLAPMREYLDRLLQIQMASIDEAPLEG